MQPLKHARLRITGIVQGVGFRPFVANLARARGLAGSVRNDIGGVTVQLFAREREIVDFAQAVREHAPAAAVVESVELEFEELGIAHGSLEAGKFEILESPVSEGAPSTAVSPDLALCPDCRRELLDPTDRRHLYPFINCTNCGPRYSIVRSLPYDRERTTMQSFDMCAACAREYNDSEDRRYHAQPNACPVCGPEVTFQSCGTEARKPSGQTAIDDCVTALQAGQIVAVKGIGGFHLFADATSDETVDELRRRKHRDAKPFAVMFPDLETLSRYAEVSDAEARLLASPAAPIVLVRSKPDTPLARSIAPGNPWLGALLPYSPLHVLLMKRFGVPAVATSANLSEEPLCRENAEAQSRLQGIADGLLTHNRDVARPVDDSVQRVTSVGPVLLRRARGYAPAPFRLPEQLSLPEPLLAVGGHLKNTVALARGRQVVVSPHIGNLENKLAERACRETIELLCGLYENRPSQVVCDLHPDYASTRIAEEMRLPLVRVQHHLAHILACLLEHGGGPDRVLGFSWDGTGYGEDGTIWGGEAILVDQTACSARRVGWLRPFSLPGGDAAALETARCTLGALHAAKLTERPAFQHFLERQAASGSPLQMRPLLQMLKQGLNCPTTTSAGRLFDAAAALLGLCPANRFEGEAGMAVEFAAARAVQETKRLPWGLREHGAAFELDWAPMMEAISDQTAGGADAQSLAMQFHRTLADMIAETARAVGVEDVVLTGGCFQNAILLELTSEQLRDQGHRTWLHRRLPPGDNAISAGQIYAAVSGITRVS